MNFKELAHHHGMTCFFNSLLLEDAEGKLLQTVGIKNEMKHMSLVGRHSYTGRILRQNQSITLNQAAKLLSLNETFSKRLEDSLNNTELFLERRMDAFKKNFAQLPNFIEAEQSLFVGHAFHPTPKNRDGFSQAELQKFSPELGEAFALSWYFVKEEVFYQKSSPAFQDLDWLKKIFKTDIPQGYIAYPLHPWQEKLLLENPVIQKYISSQVMIRSHSQELWAPTSSLRTLYSKSSPYMLKFSMGVRLTNSLRHLLLHELERGLDIHEAMMKPRAQEFLRAHHEFEVIHEPVFAGIKDQEGNPLKDSLIMGRLNPFTENSQVMVLATLTQDHPQFDGNLVAVLIQKSKLSPKEWFKEFLKVSIRPLLKAQSDLGVLMGSHQQNMLIEFKNFVPVKSYFRDCHGTGFNELGKDLYSKGEPINRELVKYLFGYYVIINSTFNMLHAVSKASISEYELLKELKLFLLDLKAEKPKDSSFLDYLLQEPTLKHKGNFFCSLKDINENTHGDPLAIYTDIKNPLYEIKL